MADPRSGVKRDRRVDMQSCEQPCHMDESIYPAALVFGRTFGASATPGRWLTVELSLSNVRLSGAGQM